MPAGEKQTCTFFFQATRPEAMGCDDFAMGRDQAGNVKSVLADILGHGNAAHGAMLPRQVEAEGARRRIEAEALEDRGLAIGGEVIKC